MRSTAAALMTSPARWRRPMPSDEGPAYEVGYRKPPRRTRFKPGQSGNPRGRPKGAKDLSSLFTDALNELVVVTENGRRRKVSKCRAFVTQLVNQSAKGDRHAIKILLDILRDIEARSDP